MALVKVGNSWEIYVEHFVYLYVYGPQTACSLEEKDPF